MIAGEFPFFNREGNCIKQPIALVLGRICTCTSTSSESDLTPS